MDSTKTNPQPSQVSFASNKGVTNANSTKMGSRRIFTPQFKLQVLESYRNDHDCKGNQRATARKYNIHRRQIQKWLQCEPSLRSSVANINQNSVKHQFHNVSMQPQQTKNVAITTQQSSVNSLSYPTSQQHSAHLCLDTAKGLAAPKNINVVPSLSSCANASTALQENQDILDDSLVAVVSATSGTIIRTNTSSTTSATAATVVTPLRPAAIISANRNTSSSMSPLLHQHHHHHHHYAIPTYNNTMSSTATVPILVHHLTNSQQASYQYHNMPYTTPTLSHHHTEKQHTASYFTPINLPTINCLSADTSVPNNVPIEKLDLFPIGTKAYPSKILTDKSFFYNDNQFHVTYECPDAARVINSSKPLEPFNINNFNVESSYLATYPYGPMDLSLRHSKETKSEPITTTTKTSSEPTELPIKKESNCCNTLDVVDLTYRKRKANSNAAPSNDYKTEFREKQAKLSNPTVVQNELVVHNSNEIGSNHLSSNPNEDDDIEIEVGIEEKFPPASKPVKLFKPYLLDECENKNENNCITNNANKLRRTDNNKEFEQSVKKDDVTTTTENTFPNNVKDNNTTCVDSTNFLVESRSESPRSACSPATYMPTMSPTTFQYPKGSPASSGYESSTSTYSDTSISSRNETYAYGQTYSLNLQMQAIYHENIHVINPSKHVQRWLEKDDSNSLETNSSIALLV